MHPDVNALADLAADVLPVEEARAVEAHVIACPDCADLLADSERIRPLLLSDDVGPMPADVWQRLSGVLAEESTARSALGGHVVPMAPVPAPASAPWDQHWQVDGAEPAETSDTQWWTGQDAGWQRSPLDPGAAAAAAENTVRDQHVPPADGTPLARRRRDADPRLDQTGHDPTFDATEVWDSFDLRDRNVPPAASAPSSPSDGDDGTGLTRIARPLADLSPGAPGGPGDSGERPNETTSTLSALGGGRASGLRKTGRVGGPSRRDVRDSTRAESRAERGPGRLRSLTSGRRAPMLAAAAGVVVAAGIGGFAWNALSGDGGTSEGGPDVALPSLAPVSAPVLTTGKNYSEAGLGDEAKALVKASKGKKPGLESAAANFTGSAVIAQPKVLAKCLDALNATSQTPIAVDLAQYKNREAAIIVLTGQDGGYEVWAVSRDCGSGDESTLSFVAVPAD
jgi:hypothetical protein